MLWIQQFMAIQGLRKMTNFLRNLNQRELSGVYPSCLAMNAHKPVDNPWQMGTHFETERSTPVPVLLLGPCMADDAALCLKMT